LIDANCFNDSPQEIIIDVLTKTLN
jgi:hypothetical protein